MHQLSPKGVKFIHSFESCAKKRSDGQFDAYPDPGSKDGKPWTIGWGSTGSDIARGTVWTQQQCDDRFNRDIVRYVKQVADFIGDAPTSDDQFDALVSFHYNTGAIASSTLGRLHKAGRFDDAAAQFGKWINNGGKPMEGLRRRRAAEAALYLDATPAVTKQPMPVAQADIRVVNASSGLNVRATPSAAGVKLGSLVHGTAVTVLEDIGDWVRFTYNGKTAWVNDQFLTSA